MIPIKLPADPEQIGDLCIGDAVSVTGTVVTARDAAHHFLWHSMIQGNPGGKDADMYDELKEICRASFIYHSGPIMRKEGNEWQCISAGPTTSIREEPYEADIIREFGLAGIIGKGGMGDDTLRALSECTAVYLSAVGGAGAAAAGAVTQVRNVFKPEFGMPEAMWVLDIEDFPAIVTMDSSGKSLHSEIEEHSREQFRHMCSS